MRSVKPLKPTTEPHRIWLVTLPREFLRALADPRRLLRYDRCCRCKQQLPQIKRSLFHSTRAIQGSLT